MIETPPPPFFLSNCYCVSSFTSIKNQQEIFTKTLLNYYNALKYADLLYLVITSIKICSSIVNFFQNFVQYWYTSNVMKI